MFCIEQDDFQQGGHVVLLSRPFQSDLPLKLPFLPLSCFPKVEDLFYNVAARRKAFRSPAEEYARILDVVSRFAVHHYHVSFSCKKVGPLVANTAAQHFLQPQ